MKIRLVIRDWWPIVVPFAIVITAQVIFQSNVVANGAHASDHLRSATAPFPTFFLLMVIMWASTAARRRVGIWVIAVLLSISSLVIMFGNLLVVKAIAGDSWSNEQANAFGHMRPGFELGHSIVQFGELAGAATLLLLVLVLRTHGIIRTGPAIVATGLALLGLALPGLGFISILALFVTAIDVCSQRVRWIHIQLRKTRGAQKN
jgi:hypothetical protein